MPRAVPNSRWKSFELLKTKDVERWYDNVTRGSEVTAKVYLRRLRGFCESMETTPMQLISNNEKTLFDLLLDFVSYEERRGMTGSYIHSTLKAVKSWLSFSGIFVRGNIRIKGVNQTPTIEDERVPTQDELKKIFLNATPRDRVCCVLMAHAGLRPGVLGIGNDGLRIKDLPELHFRGETIMFKKVPAKIIVRPNLSKAGHKYITFLSEEGCDYLKEYLEFRLREGETLTPDSDLISPKSVKKKFLSSTKSRDCVRKSIRKAGLTMRPYVLRAYFDTQLLLAESKGKMTHSYRQFFMGHKGDMEARYTVNKGRLTNEMVEDMRDAYRRSQSYFRTTLKPKDEQDFSELENKMTQKIKLQETIIAGLQAQMGQMAMEIQKRDTAREQLQKKVDQYDPATLELIFKAIDESKEAL